MKSKIEIYLKLMTIIIMVISLVGCGWIDDDDDDDSGDNDLGTIVEIAAEDGRFTILLQALEAAELDDDLEGDGPFTVFAPTDTAFGLLPAGTVDDLLLPENQATLIDLLLYHAYDDAVMEADVAPLDGTAINMLNGSDMRIDLVGDDVILNLNGNRQATVTVTDIEASNGVIHVIDAVLDPNDATDSIVETAIADGSFTTLAAALTAAELVDDLEGDGPFTVFAPTDTAFALLPVGVVDDLLLPENQATLIDLLLYHVYDGSVLAEDVIALDGSSVTMLNSGSVAITVPGGAAVMLNEGGNREATVTITDVLCSNGVIHVIDAVLDPADSP